MVWDELPARVTEPCEVPPVGAWTPANGSTTAAVIVVGLGWKAALPDLLKPPTSCTLAAVTLALPLAISAVADFELMTTLPGTLMTPLPEMVKAPLALASRR